MVTDYYLSPAKILPFIGICNSFHLFCKYISIYNGKIYLVPHRHIPIGKDKAVVEVVQDFVGFRIVESRVRHHGVFGTGKEDKQRGLRDAADFDVCAVYGRLNRCHCLYGLK